jgi:hypothetical protein
MGKNLINLETELSKLKKEFLEAQEKYLEACRSFQPFLQQELLLSPPLARAAYSDRMAWIMATMADLAYITFERGADQEMMLSSGLKSGGFTLLATFNRQGSQGFLAKGPDYLVLALRGTQTDEQGDLKTDARAYQIPTKDGSVHAGFEEAYNLIADEVLDSLRKTEVQPIYITGHSLGAALATVATQQLEQEFHDRIAACYTFGSPRVGDGKYEKNIKVPFYRVVNTIDIVTMVPIYIPFFFKYIHVGDPRYLNRGQVLYRGIPSLFRTWEALVEICNALIHLKNPLMPFVEAHGIKRYIAKLLEISLKRNRLA